MLTTVLCITRFFNRYGRTFAVSGKGIELPFFDLPGIDFMTLLGQSDALLWNSGSVPKTETFMG